MTRRPSPLADALENALPQTQCTRCGFADCRAYAEAIALDGAAINQCPPGGAAGVALLGSLTGHKVIALNPAHGLEGERRVAVIDEAWCIGCTLCIKACPVDAIIGASKHMHTVIAADCTGCELCIAPCPVDCITLISVTPGRTGWQAWSTEQANAARERYHARGERLSREEQEKNAALEAKRVAHLSELDDQADPSLNPDPDAARKREIIEAAMARALARDAKP
jgi:Na+-translocating ferredoxin:NAD+ oxidoreductase subunit B